MQQGICQYRKNKRRSTALTDSIIQYSLYPDTRISLSPRRCFPASVQNSNQESIKLFPNYVAKIVYPVFSLKGIDEKGDLSNHIITETGENIQLKEFEMNNEAINLITNANLISAPELIRKILFYLENESNIKEMLSMDDNIKKSTTKRRLTVRKTRLRNSVSLNSFSACGD